MSAFEIEIANSAGVVLGFGPLVTGQFWDQENPLDRAGAVSCTVPWSDPRTDLITARQTFRCSTMLGGRWQRIGAGVVDALQEDMQAAQSTLLSVTGNSLLIGLADRAVGDLVLSDSAHGHNENPMAAGDILAAIMSMAPAGWTILGSPSEGTYLAFGGESVLAALGKLAQQIGDHFRCDANQVLTWLPKTVAPLATGIRAMGSVPNPQAMDATTCLITRINRKRDLSNQASRVYAYGAGNAGARVTLSGATYALPAGYSYGSDMAGAYIKHDAADAAGRIDAIQTFPDVAALDTAAGHAPSATNALAQAATVWLSRHIGVYYSYDLEVAGLSQAVLPGQTIRVVHDTYAAGRRVSIVDADLLVLGTKQRIDADGSPRVVTLTLANTDRWPEDDTMLTALTASRTQGQSSHLQVAQRSLTADAVGGPAFTPGSIPFVGPDGFYTQDNPHLFWDDTNNRLSIGQNVPIAPIDMTLVDASTTGAPRLMVIRHNTSGTPATLYGDEIQWLLQSSTTADQVAARLRVTWVDATHATRTSRLQLFVVDSVQSTREGLRIEGTGTAPAIGFLGANAVARPTVTGSRGANAALASLLTALASLGLVTDSSTV